MLLFKIAWRNILCHKRRSVFAMLIITVGVCCIILFGGFIEANAIGLRESIIRGQYGHLQIYRQGFEANYRQEPNQNRMSPELVQQTQVMLADMPQVLLTSRRIEFTGLLGNEKISRATVVRGVDPDNEALINSALTILAGTELDADEPEGVLLGEGLAQSVNAHVGDTLTLLSATVNGVMNAVEVKVVGIFQSFAKEYDDAAMMMVMENAQRLLNTDSVDTMVVLLDDTAALDTVVAALAGNVKRDGLNIEWMEWYKMDNSYQKIVDLYDGFFLFINLLIYLVVMFGIGNTMMVNVMERSSEIGTLRAMGMRRGGIVRLLLVEGLLLALLGSVLGGVAGNVITWFVNSLGIMMPPQPGSSKGYPLHLQYVEHIWASSLLFVAAIAFFATLVPAMQASRKEIVDALRHI